MRTPLGAIIGVALVLFMVVFLLHFSIASLSVLDTNIDVNSTYSTQYNTTTDTAKASFALMQFMPLLLIVGVLIFTMVFFAQLGKGR